MNIRDASILLRGLMTMHGLRPLWAFEFDNARRRAGFCRRHDRVISLSRHYVKMNDLPEVTNTILHEIAHALTKGGHGSEWKQKAVEIGCNGQRNYGGEVKMPPRKWLAVCPECGPLRSRYHRRVRLVCLRCNSSLEYVRFVPTVDNVSNV